jgi:hypothetical protein
LLYQVLRSGCAQRQVAEMNIMQISTLLWKRVSTQRLEETQGGMSVVDAVQIRLR